MSEIQVLIYEQLYHSYFKQYKLSIVFIIKIRIEPRLCVSTERAFQARIQKFFKWVGGGGVEEENFEKNNVC